MRFVLAFVLAMLTTISFSQRRPHRHEAVEKSEAIEKNDVVEKNEAAGKNEATEKKEAVEKNDSYNAWRVKLTVPPYGLERIQEMIKKIRKDDEDNAALSIAEYNSLSLREKFTYNMIHAESFSQICDYIPMPKNAQMKIFAYLPDAYGEHNWSERQTKFFSGNRDSVIQFMKESMGRTKRAGVNFKQAMLEINAKEMIPDIIATFKANKTVKDLDLLTVLMNLMKDNEYEPFLVSGSYKKLYAEETSYSSYLNNKQENVDLIIKRATDFYLADKNDKKK